MLEGAAVSQPFDALVFDLGGVVVAHDNAVLFDRLASGCAGGCSREAVRALFLETRWGDGAAPISDFHGQMRQAFGYRHDWPRFVEDWTCHFTFDPSMFALLQALSRDHRVILFSNTNQEHWQYLLDVTDGAIGAFEAFLSHRMGLSKPTLASFNHVAAGAGIDPTRSVFFDDVAANVEAARRAGFQAEVFVGEPWLRAWLGERGIAG